MVTGSYECSTSLSSRDSFSPAIFSLVLPLVVAHCRSYFLELGGEDDGSDVDVFSFGTTDTVSLGAAIGAATGVADTATGGALAVLSPSNQNTTIVKRFIRLVIVTY